MRATPQERDAVRAYFEAQLDDDPVVHLEKVAVERVGSVVHETSGTCTAAQISARNSSTLTPHEPFVNTYRS
jgi:hypothetical protein